MKRKLEVVVHANDGISLYNYFEGEDVGFEVDLEYGGVFINKGIGEDEEIVAYYPIGSLISVRYEDA